MSRPEATAAARAPAPGPGLSYPLDTAPIPGASREVAPGVHWLRMPLPFALDHINLWLLEDGDGYTLVDCGLSSDAMRAVWEGLLAELPATPHRILLTHFHPDHIGLAGWLHERLGAPLYASATEWLMGVMLYNDAEARTAATMLRFFADHGLAQHWLEQLNTGNRYRRLVSAPPTQYVRLRHDDRLRIGNHDWRMITGRGHSPEHLCLYCEDLGVLISGDQVLPRITPNISVHANEPDANPLQEYLDSLVQFRDLPADTLVLPAHGFPFHGLHARIDYLDEHHGDRFELILQAFEGRRMQAAELLPVLFRRELDAHQMMFAMGETLSHLACLCGRGRLRRERDADGRYHFRI